MKITVKGGGGLAGALEHFELDTGHLPRGGAVEAMLQNLDFFQAPAEPAPLGFDIPRWEITVDDGQRCRTVEFADDGGPGCARWKPLLDRLRSGG
ncbi:MAG: protealysin inhibitor emfourin [Telluria sp.]